MVVSSGLRGEIYFIPVDTAWLPDFKHLKPVGTIFTTSLNVPPSNFEQGFPGITSRFEWFAIDYTGKFWIEQGGWYAFGLTSDDGSKLYIDGRVIIDNDGQHVPASCKGAVELAPGVHTLRVSYFQGPRFQVALSLGVQRPGGSWQVFDTRDFTPGPNSAVWSSPDQSPNQEKAGQRPIKVQRGTCFAR